MGSYQGNNKLALWICVCVVALFAHYLRTSPHILFRVPQIGFVLHAMLTGHPPPGYMVPDAWNEKELMTWIKDGDLVVSGGFKSGTHWLLYCSHQIRMKGVPDADDLFQDVNLATPWIDLKHAPGVSWEEHKREMHSESPLPSHIDGGRYPWSYYWNNVRYPFRIFKSHYTPKESGGFLPVKSFPKVKFLAIARNGLDVARSTVPFFDSHDETFRKTWGGFPPANNHKLDEKKAMKDTIHDFFPPNGNLKPLYFDYIKEWWPMRNESNVLLLHYSDVKKDLRGSVAKIADFVGVKMTSQELNNVSNRCSIEHMRSPHLQGRYQVQLVVNKMNGGNNVVVKPGSTVRSGKIGEGRQSFAKEDIAMFEKYEQEEFGHIDGLLDWTRFGSLV